MDKEKAVSEESRNSTLGLIKKGYIDLKVPILELMNS